MKLPTPTRQSKLKFRFPSLRRVTLYVSCQHDIYVKKSTRAHQSGPQGPTEKTVPFFVGHPHYMVSRRHTKSRVNRSSFGDKRPNRPTEPAPGPTRPKTKKNILEPHTTVARRLTPNFVSIRGRLDSYPDNRPSGPTEPVPGPTRPKTKKTFWKLILQ